MGREPSSGWGRYSLPVRHIAQSVETTERETANQELWGDMPSAVCRLYFAANGLLPNWFAVWAAAVGRRSSPAC